METELCSPSTPLKSSRLEVENSFHGAGVARGSLAQHAQLVRRDWRIGEKSRQRRSGEHQRHGDVNGRLLIPAQRAISLSTSFSVSSSAPPRSIVLLVAACSVSARAKQKVTSSTKMG